MVFRAWFAIRESMTDPDGQDVRGAYGFLNTFFKVIRERRPTHVAVTFDTPAPTFRDAMFAEYKAHRPPVDPDLKAQIPIVKEIMAALNVPVYELDGYEADDLVGTISWQVDRQGGEVIILTGDADQLQLVSANVKVLMYSGFGDARLYNELEVTYKYDGLTADLVPDIKALEGDKSDNIPGVPGIGPKAARTLLNRFDNLHRLLENLEHIPGVEGLRGAKRIQNLITEHRETALLSYKLATIVRDVPVDFSLTETIFGNFTQSVAIDTLMKYRFRSIVRQLSRISTDNTALADTVQSTQPTQSGLVQGLLLESAPGLEDPPAIAQAVDEHYEVVDDISKLEAMLTEITVAGGFGFDTETDNLVPSLANLVGLSLAVESGRAWYVPVGHTEGKQLSYEQVVTALRPLFADEVLLKTAHNANFDLTVLAVAGIAVEGAIFDTMIAATICGYKATGLKQLALELFHMHMTPISDLLGTGRNQLTMDQVAIAKVAPYAAADARVALQLRPYFTERIERHNQHKTFYQIETPLLPVVVSMQANGMQVEQSLLQAMSAELAHTMDETEEIAEKVLGRRINIRSTRQLAAVLIDELHAPRTRKTKSGWSMDANALDNIMHTPNLDERVYQLAEAALLNRQLLKLKSTYTDAIPTLISPRDGRVHTTFNQVGSATGRFSSTDPNIQNIPVRTKLGNKIRKAFVASGENGSTLLSVDYSQIELRILAHMSQEPALLEAFRNGEDIHAATARAMYEDETVTSEQRRVAKILNFGVIYGLGPHGVARQTDLTQAQGKEFIELYFGKYPGIKGFIEETKHLAKTRGYCETLCGRRRYLPDLKGKGAALAAAERIAVNMPIQGTAADVIKLAMIALHKEMHQHQLRTLMVAQVHDELIFEVALGEMQRITELVGSIMPAAMPLLVPLEVEMKQGPNWGEMEKVAVPPPPPSTA